MPPTACTDWLKFHVYEAGSAAPANLRKMADPISLPLLVLTTRVQPAGAVTVMSDPFRKTIWAVSRSPSTAAAGLLTCRLVAAGLDCVVTAVPWKVIAASAAPAGQSSSAPARAKAPA